MVFLRDPGLFGAVESVGAAIYECGSGGRNPVVDSGTWYCGDGGLSDPVVV